MNPYLKLVNIFLCICETLSWFLLIVLLKGLNDQRVRSYTVTWPILLHNKYIFGATRLTDLGRGPFLTRHMLE